MRLGYNTNGLAHHATPAALELLAELGYRSVALTIDHHCLDPFAADFERRIEATRDELRRLGLRCVVETGARFLLDPGVKHEPTLVTRDAAARRRRVEFLRAALDVAAALDADCISCWSGILRDDVDEVAAFERLADGLGAVLTHAERRGVDVGFEPEPGMFVDTMERFDRLLAACASPRLKLTLDVGHLHCQGETPIAAYVERYAPWLVNVHLEDMRRGVHEHLEFGAGEMDFPPILAALRRIGYGGGVHVELSRHSHDGPAAARRARDFLAPLTDWE